MESRVTTLGRHAAYCELMAAKAGKDEYERRMWLARARLYRERQARALEKRECEIVLANRAPVPS